MDWSLIRTASLHRTGLELESGIGFIPPDIHACLGKRSCISSEVLAISFQKSLSYLRLTLLILLKAGFPLGEFVRANKQKANVIGW